MQHPGHSTPQEVPRTQCPGSVRQAGSAQTSTRQGFLGNWLPMELRALPTDGWLCSRSWDQRTPKDRGEE